MRFLVFVLTVLSCIALFGSNGAEAAKKKAATPSPPKPIYMAPMRVVIVRNSDPKCEPTCPQWIAAEGEIMSSTPQAFRKAFKQMGKSKLPIIIRSPGGSIEAALEIGRMIRERGLTVAVGQTNFKSCAPDNKSCKLPKQNNGVYEGVIAEDYAFCNSACPMLLSGGTTRIISYLTSAGVHQPSTTWTREYVRYREYFKVVKGKKKITNRKILSRKSVYDKTTYGLSKSLRKKLTTYYSSMGVGLAILAETEKAKFQDMNYLTQSQTDTLKLRTSPMRATYLSAPSLCGTTPTSAACILDKSRDPANAHRQVLNELGITSMSPEMTFRLTHLKGSDCQIICPTWITAEGIITPKTPAAFKEFLKTTAAANLSVVLHSQGGDLRAAMALGEEIRLRSLDTSIGRTRFEALSGQPNEHTKPGAAQVEDGGVCQGSCILVFAGGQHRDVGKGAKVALHEPSVYKELAGSSAAIVEMNLYLRRMGVTPTFMSSLYQIKRGKPRQFQKSELLTYAVATDTRDFGEFFEPNHCRVNKQTRGCFSYSAKSEVTKTMASPKTAVKPLLEGRFNRMTFKHFRNSNPECEPKCPSWIFAQGRIEKGSLEDLKLSTSGRTLLNAMLVLDSPGGNEMEALALGKFIHEAKMHTTVGITAVAHCAENHQSCMEGHATISESEKGVCHGECVLLFIAGTDRYLSEKIELMPNGYQNVDGGRMSILKYYLQDILVSDYLITAFESKTNWNNHPLSASQAKAQNIATQIVPSIAAIFDPQACNSTVKTAHCR